MKPLNEMGVIVEFAKACEAAGWEIISIQAAFPDVLIMNSKTGESYRAEFEYNSSSFYVHKHDPSNCDLIICWVHDWKECVMPVWELSDPNWTATAFINRMDDKDRKIMSLLVDVAYWKAKAIEAQNNSPKTKKGSNAFSCGCGEVYGSQSALNAHQRKHKQIAGYAVSFEPIAKEQAAK